MIIFRLKKYEKEIYRGFKNTRWKLWSASDKNVLKNKILNRAGLLKFSEKVQLNSPMKFVIVLNSPQFYLTPKDLPRFACIVTILFCSIRKDIDVVID